MCAQSLSRVRLFVTPWTEARQASLSKGFSSKNSLVGCHCPPPGNLPNLRIKLACLRSPALVGIFFTTSTTWAFLGAQR